MMTALDFNHKTPFSPSVLNLHFTGSEIPQNMLKIEAGNAHIGADFCKQKWGWDIEFPHLVVQVPEFEMDEFPVTNAQFFEFLHSGEYDKKKWWTEDDWKWKNHDEHLHPYFWVKNYEGWYVRHWAGLIPMEKVWNWPVYVTLAEAKAFAKWKGKELPSESQFLRAAYGTPSFSFNNKHPKKFPWGNDEPVPGLHGNFGFASWGPAPVDFHPKGKSAFGIQDLIGNGWEWTCTILEALPGFQPYLSSYQGYSKDFFDDEHTVILGASWATHPKLIRSSFRNWFQGHYPFLFSKFRCVSKTSTKNPHQQHIGEIVIEKQQVKQSL